MRIPRLLARIVDKWSRDNVPRLAASLAFYTAFSLAPLVVISISIAGLVFGEDAARGRMVEQIQGLVGNEAAAVVQDIVARARAPGTGLAATVAGLAALFLGAAGVFAELQDSLNAIWGIRRKRSRRIGEILRDRFLSFAMVVGAGFLLLVSLVVSAALEGLGRAMSGRMADVPTLKALNMLLSLAVITCLFAVIFKVLPDARTRWKDIWLGAGLTAGLFVAGKALIGLYLGRSTFASAYGAAASFVVLLVWIYYSCQVFLLGAEFTHVYADTYGGGIVPSFRPRRPGRRGSRAPAPRRRLSAGRRGTGQ